MFDTSEEAPLQNTPPEPPPQVGPPGRTELLSLVLAPGRRAWFGDVLIRGGLHKIISLFQRADPCAFCLLIYV